MIKALEPELIPKLAEEYQSLARAKEILEHVYAELGPYDTRISQPLMIEMHNYFGFDDSE